MQLETFFTVQEQTRLFFLAVLGGMLLSVLYDLLRILRAILRHGRILVALEDVLFLLAWGIELAGFASLFARGELRAYYAAGNLFGFFLWRLLLGNPAVGAVRRVSDRIRQMIRLLTAPLRGLQVRVSKKIQEKFVRIRQKSKKEPKNAK